MTLGDMIERARKGRFSQQALGEKIGVWGTYIGQIESGKRVPSDERCLDLAAILDLDPRALLIQAYRQRAHTREARRLFDDVAGMIAGTAGRHSPGVEQEETPPARIGSAGEPPFTRGAYPTMYRGRLWTIRQYAGFSTPAETNVRFRALLDRGQTGLSVAFDLPTQMGYDSDHPNAEGEVGRVGVAVDGLWDLEILFDEIPLDRISTSMTINATACILFALYAALGKRRGLPASALAGTVQNDILKEYVSRGTYIFPISHSMRLVVDLMGYCLREAPKWNPVSVSGYHMREAGATAAQELGFTLAHALAYADAAREAGLEMERVLPTFSFFFGVHNHFLEEIAKFRAARRLWSRLVEERLRVRDPRCRRLRFHAQTAGSTLTAQQPLNNCARTTLQALAAVLGGAQSLHVNAYDEALGLPSDAGAQLAVRTQQILAYESGIPETVDPMGGSYAAERLTDDLEEEAIAVLESVDGEGGAAEAAANGFTAACIAESAYDAQKQIESGETVVVGVNRYQDAADQPVSAFQPPRDAECTQKARLASARSPRDSDATNAALDVVERRARGEGSITEAVVAACSAGATVGEISDRLRAAFGSYGTGG
ncbi:MAG: methylmalonyl-CoA mutase family protein [Gemmatimonadota bacterium]|nr:methylmalonyl-CoA mutase family protein [Gemmatimonadota bacterium]